MTSVTSEDPATTPPPIQLLQSLVFVTLTFQETHSLTANYLHTKSARSKSHCQLLHILLPVASSQCLSSIDQTPSYDQ